MLCADRGVNKRETAELVGLSGPVAVMDVSEEVKLRFCPAGLRVYLPEPIEQVQAPCNLPLRSPVGRTEIAMTIGRAVREQDVDIIGDLRPDLRDVDSSVSHEVPVEEGRRDRTPPELEPPCRGCLR